MADFMINLKDFIEAIKASKPKTSAYDTIAEVKRIEGNTAWVHIPGGKDETPVRKTINAQVGDTVQVRVSGGSAFLVGNASAPPTDDTEAVKAKKTATDAKDTAETASEVAEDAARNAQTAHEAAQSAITSAQEAAEAAEDAQDSADAAQASATNANEYASRALGNLSTVQSVAETLTWITQHGTMTLTTDTSLDPTHVYFVRDANGDYTVGSYHYSIVAEPDADDLSTYYVLSIDESLNNYVGTHLALTSEGLWLLPASSGSYKVLIATGAGSTYTSAGIYLIDNVGTGAVMAKFTSNEMTIGEVLSGNYVLIDNDSVDIYHANTLIAHFGYGSGNNDQGGTSTAPYYTIGKRVANSSVGNYSVANGENVDASGFASNAEGHGTEASGYGSHAEGYGYYYGAGNQNNTYIKATNTGAHAEGFAAYGDIIASGIGSHAEGRGPIDASGIGAHAEGDGTEASAYAAHAEGKDTVASGYASHAQNAHTIAESTDQTAMGRWNVADPNDKYALIIGNGDDDQNRSNAFVVKWDGTVETAKGTLTAQTPTTTWTEPAVASNQATIQNGGYYTEGKHVYVQMEIKLTSALSADTTLSEFLTGFPLPSPTLGVLSIETSTGAYGWAGVKTNGKLSIRLNKQVATTASIYITGSYTSA